MYSYATTIVFVVLILQLFSQNVFAESYALLNGLPPAVTNLADHRIYVSGDQIVSYKYRFGSGDYSEEIPVSTPIDAASIVTANGVLWRVGTPEFQQFLDQRSEFVSALSFLSPKTDLEVVYLLNPKRFKLKEENVVTLAGVGIDSLNIEIKPGTAVSAPSSGLSSLAVTGGRLKQTGPGLFQLEVPVSAPAVTFTPVAARPGTAIAVNGQPMPEGATAVSLTVAHGESIELSTVTPEGVAVGYSFLVAHTAAVAENYATRSHFFAAVDLQADMVRLVNQGTGPTSFRMNFNDALFTAVGDLLQEITALPDEFPLEPIQRKAWRFIISNRYHWYPLTGAVWHHAPPLFFNSVGFGFCDDSASLYYHIMSALGFPARVWSIGGHVVPEVQVNGRWELYDPDLEVYYLTSVGDVAGAEELMQNPQLITSPINPVASDPWAYSADVAALYASTNDNLVAWWYHENPVQNYQLNFALPAAGTLDFPGIFVSPLSTLYSTTAPSYTSSRLSIPKGTAFAADTQLVVQSITPLNGSLMLSVLGKDSAGNWQTVPTTATWDYDSATPPQPVTSLNVSSDKPSPQITGTGVTFTASASGVEGTYEYYFTYFNPYTGSWHAGQAYSTQNGWTWDTTGYTPGNYSVVVWARQSGVSEVYKQLTYTIAPPPVSALSVTADKPAPQLLGSKITFTAVASGGSGSYDYFFTYRDPLNIWRTGQEYSANNSWTLDTAGMAAGAYRIEVWARNSGSAAIYEKYWATGFEIADAFQVGRLYCGSLQEAYAQAVDGSVIRVLAGTWPSTATPTEYMTAGVAKTVTIEGGYDLTFTGNAGGTSTVIGRTNLNAGTVIMKQVAIR